MSNLCDPIYWSTPGFSVFHYFPKFSQTHVHLMSRQWCHPIISSSVAPFSSCLQSFPASGSFWLFASDGQSIGASASAVSPSNEYPQLVSFRIDLISLLSKGLSRAISSTTVWKHQFLGTQPSLWSNSHICTCFCTYFLINWP